MRLQSRRKQASDGLAFAEKRLALADVLLKGGFPEEMTRPLREALGWALPHSSPCTATAIPPPIYHPRAWCRPNWLKTGISLQNSLKGCPWLEI